MSVDAAEPEDGGEDEFLADDNTPVEAVPVEVKRRGRPMGMSRLESAKLSEEIWEEFAQGSSPTQIADLHGMTPPAVRKRIREHRLKMGIEDITEAKALDLGRYEALIEKMWVAAFKDPTPENVKTLAVLMDQRAKLLGLNAPKKLQVDGQMELTPSPAFLGHLDRLVETRERLGGEVSRAELTGSKAEIVDAELVSDDDG